MDSTFYEKFYKYMTNETFISISKASPPNFQLSLKIPESITHEKCKSNKRMLMTIKTKK
jgi:uncharacterized protein YecE (DUF72 family)